MEITTLTLQICPITVVFINGRTCGGERHAADVVWYPCRFTKRPIQLPGKFLHSRICGIGYLLTDMDIGDRFTSTP